MTREQLKRGAAWTVGAVTALAGLIGAAAATASQVSLTREKADAIYETKEKADQRFERIQEKLDVMDDKLDTLMGK